MQLAKTKPLGKCERVIVRTVDGRVFDLGSPNSILFRFRKSLYLWKRRKELNRG